MREFKSYPKPIKQEKKAKKPIRKVSKKHQVNLKEYKVVRDAFLEENPRCQFEGCNREATEVHHVAGRNGKLLSNPKYFMAICRDHHVWCELNSIEAKEKGYSVNRLNK